MLGLCDNYLYTKSDGSLKCGSFLEHKLTIFDASQQCFLIGAIIPEIPSPNDQQILNILRVSKTFQKILFSYTTADDLGYIKN